MLYSEHGDRVTLEMTREDYEVLLIMLGCATGMALRDGDKPRFYRWLSFVNDLNAGNPNYKPYEIPPEFQ